MQVHPRLQSAAKIGALGLLTLVSGFVGAALASNFGNSSISISYIDFISVVLTCLGVMLTAVTLFVGVLAVIGWTSIETKLRNHSVEFIGSELNEDKPLGLMIRKAVRDAVYEGVAPADDEARPDHVADEGQQ